MMQQELGRVTNVDIMISAGVSDGGNNMRNAAKEFAGMLSSFCFLMFSICYKNFIGGEIWACVAHLLNLCIRDTLTGDECHDVADFIDKVNKLFIFNYNS